MGLLDRMFAGSDTEEEEQRQLIRELRVKTKAAGLYFPDTPVTLNQAMEFSKPMAESQAQLQQKKMQDSQDLQAQTQRFANAPSIPLQEPSLLVKHFIDEVSRTGLPPSQETVGGFIQGAYRPEQRGVGMISPFTEKGNSVTEHIPTSRMTPEQESERYRRGMIGALGRAEEDALARAKRIKEASFAPDKSITGDDDLEAEARRLGLEGGEKFKWKQDQRAESAGKLTSARAKSWADTRLEYLPEMTRQRIQTEIDTRFSPENIAKSTAKVESELRARLAGGPVPEAAQDDLIRANKLRASIRELNDEFSPEDRRKYVGFIRNPMDRALQYVAADPNFAKFQAIMGRIKASAFDDAGKNFTATEMKYVQQYVPQGTEASWEDFEAKLSLADKAPQFIIDNRLYFMDKNRGEVARSGIPDAKLGKATGQPVPGRAPKILSIQRVD